MFDINTLPVINIKKTKNGDFSIRKSKNSILLLEDHEVWMGINTHNNNTIKQMYSSYDLAYGNVLLTGLGFGILALWLDNKDSVKNVTVIEKSKEVIDMFLDANPNANIKIINQDANLYVSNDRYDCLIMDHFELETNMQIIDKVKKVSNNVPNHDLLWFWPVERVYAEICYNYVTKSIDYFPEISIEDHFRYATYLADTAEDFNLQWSNFIIEYLPTLKIPKISSDKINEYVYTFFNKIGYKKIVNFIE